MVKGEFTSFYDDHYREGMSLNRLKEIYEEIHGKKPKGGLTRVYNSRNNPKPKKTKPKKVKSKKEKPKAKPKQKGKYSDFFEKTYKPGMSYDTLKREYTKIYGEAPRGGLRMIYNRKLQIKKKEPEPERPREKTIYQKMKEAEAEAEAAGEDALVDEYQDFSKLQGQRYYEQENKVEKRKRSRVNYTDKIFSILANADDSQVSEEMKEKIKEEAEDNDNLTWDDFKPLLPKPHVQRNKVFYNIPTILGFKYPWSNQWSQIMRRVTELASERKWFINKLYVLWQLVRLSGIYTNWIPIQLNLRKVRELNKKWKVLAAELGVEYHPMPETIGIVDRSKMSTTKNPEEIKWKEFVKGEDIDYADLPLHLRNNPLLRQQYERQENDRMDDEWEEDDEDVEPPYPEGEKPKITEEDELKQLMDDLDEGDESEEDLFADKKKLQATTPVTEKEEKLPKPKPVTPKRSFADVPETTLSVKEYIDQINSYIKADTDKKVKTDRIPMDEKVFIDIITHLDINTQHPKIILFYIYYITSEGTEEWAGYPLTINSIRNIVNEFNEDDDIEEKYKPMMDILRRAIAIAFFIIPKKEGKYVKKSGAYFKYYHKMKDLDLRCIQIYKAEDAIPFVVKNAAGNYCEMTNMNNTACFTYALNQTLQVSEDDVRTAALFVRKGTVPLSSVDKIAKRINKHIIVRIIKKTTGALTTLHYNKTAPVTIPLNLIDDHWFAEMPIPVSKYAIKNYEKIKDDPNWGFKIRSSGSQQYNYQVTTPSSRVVRELILQKRQVLEPIPLADLMKYQNQYVPKELIKPSGKMNCGAVIYEEKPPVKTAVYFADIEATSVKGTTHEAYIACIKRMGEREVYTFTSRQDNQCVKDMLDSIPKLEKTDIFIYFHNAKYDLCHIFPFIKPLNIKENGGRTLEFQCIHNQQKITIRDSLAMIPMPLRDFAKAFDLDCKKEIFPYTFYTRETLMAPRHLISEVMLHIPEKDHKEFLRLAEEINCLNGHQFRHVEYAQYYCQQDVNVLCAGYMKFREHMREVTGLDIINSITLPSLAHKYFMSKGVYNGCYEIAGVNREFIQQSIVGGRCMMAWNRTSHYKVARNAPKGELMNDLDACSLYPSAMKRIGELGGYLLGTPKVLRENATLAELQTYDGYFVTIELINIPKELPFPTISYYHNLKRCWDNRTTIYNEETKQEERIQMVVDRFTLEDFMNFQGVTEKDFRIINGIYFNEGRTPDILDSINHLYNARKDYKAKKSPLQLPCKLLMNSGYGKLIKKAIENKMMYCKGETELINFIIQSPETVDYYTQIAGSEYLEVCVREDTASHVSLPHLGAEILSMSKRIMNEVMCTAHDLGIEIFYQDTDSMHIRNKDVDVLYKAYEQKYDRKLEGKDMGNFHCDFDSLKTKFQGKDITVDADGAVETLINAKKQYYDCVRYTLPDGSFVFKDVYRLKGIPEVSIEHHCKDEDLTVCGLYQELQAGEEHTFDLTVKASFEFTRQRTVQTRAKFTRTINKKKEPIPEPEPESDDDDDESTLSM